MIKNPKKTIGIMSVVLVIMACIVAMQWKINSLNEDQIDFYKIPPALTSTTGLLMVYEQPQYEKGVTRYTKVPLIRFRIYKGIIDLTSIEILADGYDLRFEK